MAVNSSTVIALFACALASPACTRATDIPPGCAAEHLRASPARHDIAPYAIRGRYCDGTVAILNSGELIPMSYTVGPVRFGAQQETLTVFERSRAGAPVLLQGVDMRANGSYQLDGLLGPGGLTIDLRKAIHPKAIGQDALGLVGWRDRQPQRVYVPVAVQKNTKPSDAVLVLRASAPVIQADVQFCMPSGQCTQQSTFVLNKPAGALLPLTVPASLGDGVHTVKLTVLGVANSLFAQTVLVEAPK